MVTADLMATSHVKRELEANAKEREWWESVVLAELREDFAKDEAVLVRALQHLDPPGGRVTVRAILARLERKDLAHKQPLGSHCWMKGPGPMRSTNAAEKPRRPHPTEVRAQVLADLERHPRSTVADLSMCLGLQYSELYPVLGELCDAGVVECRDFRFSLAPSDAGGGSPLLGGAARTSAYEPAASKPSSNGSVATERKRRARDLASPRAPASPGVVAPGDAPAATADPAVVHEDFVPTGEVRRLVFRDLERHPCSTAADIATRLKLPYEHVSLALHVHRRAGLLVRRRRSWSLAEVSP